MTYSEGPHLPSLSSYLIDQALIQIFYETVDTTYLHTRVLQRNQYEMQRYTDLIKDNYFKVWSTQVGKLRISTTRCLHTGSSEKTGAKYEPRPQGQDTGSWHMPWCESRVWQLEAAMCGNRRRWMSPCPQRGRAQCSVSIFLLPVAWLVPDAVETTVLLSASTRLILAESFVMGTPRNNL